MPIHKDISMEEEEKIKEFRKQLSSHNVDQYTDRYLNCWLRARRYNIEAATRMFNESMEWRAKNKVDEILDTFVPPKVMEDYYPSGICGIDRAGRPVVISPMGRIDIRGILKSVSRSEIIRTIVWKFEKMNQQLSQINENLPENEHIFQVVHILDFEGLGRQHLWMPAASIFREILNTCENNYPELQYRSFLINTPSIFPMVWSFLSKFLDPGSVKKFVILSGNWKDRVAEDIDFAQLPAFYGGEQYGPNNDEKCSDKIKWGGIVPEELYQSIETSFPDGKTSVTVYRRSQHEEVVDVLPKHTMLKYTIFSNKSVNFSIKAMVNESISPDNTSPSLAAIQDLKCEFVAEKGFIHLQPGKYVVIFDNSSSFLSSQEIIFHFSSS